ncbi:8-amino-7-oxononanoate synthase [Novosphingobium sp. Gsoil 351]|uniref:8-amino-7-oxononanoate synthase n=1 Tax=Novosphingobium sp. Gsoil 351 TaxID=2675225 RepID=UPI0012B47841|nr:8-amino-7-oxononanoate synthase [Novosphingobium sp. Gsoil 351]QGN55745.1 aminotransferase class I/II-fold pyridoxal phosphate-dependent enzyme [Novosphingobium sp. Gsoil 351]
MLALQAHRADLSRLREADRLRGLRPREGVDFASNDYLGLAKSERLRGAVADALDRGVAIGSGGSRLLRGNDPAHEALEAQAAAAFGAETALFFANGYTANLAAFGALPQRGDLVVHDALIHASAHDGMRLGRAETVAAAHNDAQAFADAAAAWRREGGTGQIWLAVESLYSMDGDLAPLNELSEIATRFEANLLIDEAHATGVFGARGLGLAENLHHRPNVIALHTCGKALGCEGALLCGPAPLREFLVNRARSFIFSTAPSPLMAVAVGEALRIVADEPGRRGELWRRVVHAEQVLAGCGVAATGSQILPLVIGDDARTMAAAGALHAAGFDVRGIRPPTVPAGTSRLRISLTLNATTDQIDALAGALKVVL